MGTLPDPSEDVIQEQIVEYLTLISRRFNFIFFSVPNESAMKAGAKGKILYALIAKLKRMGLVPGVADFVIGWRSRMFLAEVKSRTGRQTKNQIIFQDNAETTAIPYRIVRSVSDMDAALRDWGITR